MKVLIAGNERCCRDFLQDLVERNVDETMRKGPAYGYWKQSVEKLKEKWTAFTRGIICAIAEEEMRISREEFDKQIGTRIR